MNVFFTQMLILMCACSIRAFHNRGLPLVRSARSLSRMVVLYSVNPNTLQLGDVDDVAINDDSPFIDDADNLLIQRVEAEILAESGVGLDDLINPSKVINLERDLEKLRTELEITTDSVRIEEINKKMEKNRETLSIEKRAIMRGWLKNLFVGQSVIAGLISLGMVYNVLPGFPDLPLAIQVLGFWMWWLFIIPSLRARKPSAEEKKALNFAFLLTPLVSVAVPVFTKDVAIIWWANAAATAGCYIWAYSSGPDVETISEEDAKDNSAVRSMLIKAFKALDYGSGQERGVRK